MNLDVYFSFFQKIQQNQNNKDSEGFWQYSS